MHMCQKQFAPTCVTGFRWMAHDPSSPPKFMVPETGHQKLVSKLRTPDTRNWYQKHGVSNFVGSLRWCIYTH